MLDYALHDRYCVLELSCMIYRRVVTNPNISSSAQGGRNLMYWYTAKTFDAVTLGPRDSGTYDTIDIVRIALTQSVLSESSCSGKKFGGADVSNICL